MQSYMARDFTEHRKAKRYLYPATEDYPNLDVMFGEHTWPENRAESIIVVTEGAFNALAVDRVITDYVTALGGSDVRDAHIAKIATFGTVFVFTDSDEAGDRAADKLIQVLCRHTNIKRVRLPAVPNDRSGLKVPDANDIPANDLRAFLSSWLRVAVS
jgi:DNA primase